MLTLSLKSEDYYFAVCIEQGLLFYFWCYRGARNHIPHGKDVCLTTDTNKAVLYSD